MSLSGHLTAFCVSCQTVFLTSVKNTERMARLIQWMMLANWKALETVGESRTTAGSVVQMKPSVTHHCTAK